MSARATAPRTVHVEHCMGTVFSIDVRDPGDWAPAIREVVGWLQHVDAVFSTYRADSDISRIRRGELRAADAHPDVLTVLDLCAQVQAATGGFFSAMPDRRLDPTGLVKGWATEGASTLLRRRGSGNHAVNGGGDLQLAGEGRPGQPWRVGIADPADRSRLRTSVAVRDLAVATSGVSERGRHITDPFTGRAPTGFVSATVIGPSLTRVDAYATACLVLGEHAIRWARTMPDIDVLLVADDGAVLTTPGWRDLDPSPWEATSTSGRLLSESG